MYAIEHGLDLKKFSIILEAEKKRWDRECFRTVLKNDMQFYHEAIERDPRKYYTFLTDRDRLIGEELLHRGILECRLSTTWLDINTMKEWEKTHTQFIEIFA